MTLKNPSFVCVFFHIFMDRTNIKLEHIKAYFFLLGIHHFVSSSLFLYCLLLLWTWDYPSILSGWCYYYMAVHFRFLLFFLSLWNLVLPSISFKKAFSIKISFHWWPNKYELPKIRELCQVFDRFWHQFFDNLLSIRYIS